MNYIKTLENEESEKHVGIDGFGLSTSNTNTVLSSSFLHFKKSSKLY